MVIVVEAVALVVVAEALIQNERTPLVEGCRRLRAALERQS